jgi:hypothetical protein
MLDGSSLRTVGPVLSYSDDPSFGPWRVQPLAELVRLLVSASGSHAGHPPIVAIDGRSSSGKTTLAHRVTDAVPGAVVVHTDDIAWRHSVFDWADRLAEGVLKPLRRGGSVAFRPPAWDQHGRPGAVAVPAGATLVVVEGVGVGRRELADLVDAIVWVHTDPGEIERRNIARIEAGEIDPVNFAAWMAEEVPFVADQRPWERAAVVVAGSIDLPHDASQVILADPPPVPGR